MEIKSLGNTDFDAIFEAFDRAFADYEVQLNKEQLQTMLRRRGFNPALSFAAFDESRIVAFTVNGTGDFDGIPTAYDTGTGTLKEYRGQGLATSIFEYSIPYLRGAGIRQYLLEVLQHNTGAVSVYKKLGFETTREFDYSIQECAALRLGDKTLPVPCELRSLNLAAFDPDPSFRDFTPSWQNSSEAIKRATGDFIGLGAYNGAELVGYCIFEPASGDITQIAVNPQYRRKGVATLLLREALVMNKYPTVKAINTDTSCRSIAGFLDACNIGIKGRQFEMTRKI